MLLWPFRIHSNAKFQGRFSLAIPAKGMLKITEKDGVATAILCLAGGKWAMTWRLRNPGVTAIIPGCTDREQMKTNSSAADFVAE